jgi:hypothetical protein
MKDETQSRQERLLKTYFGRSMSAPFVFCPDKYGYGANQTDEPADIAWECNNCVILMYLTGTKTYGNIAKDKRRFENARLHNVTQAKKWMKDWDRYPLVGHNEYHSFFIASGTIKHCFPGFPCAYNWGRCIDPVH